jgi:predicted NodU family carbamoyl transferase
LAETNTSQDKLIITIGVHGGPRGSHEPGVSLIIDESLKFALQEERLNRTKNSISFFPTESLRILLNKFNLKISDVNNIAFAGETYKDMKMRWPDFIRHNYGNYPGKFYAINHQLSHAASGFYSSGFEKALVISLDGVGDRSCGVIAKASQKNGILPIIYFDKPHLQSLGFFWALITQLIGYNSLEEAYKTMGLAVYGNPVFDLSNLINFNQVTGLTEMAPWAIENKYKYISKHPLERIYGISVESKLNFKRRLPNSEISQQHRDLAASAQLRLEEVTVNLVKYWQKKTKEKNLVLAGGVALNSKMCGELAKSGIFENLFVPQTPSDGGLAVGAAMLTQSKLLGKHNTKMQDTPYLGLDYSQSEVEIAVKHSGYRHIRNNQNIIAQLLVEDKVIAYFNGRSEHGPRALGARSILANPSRNCMKNIVNLKIKFRESYRPFAPVVRDCDLEKYFIVPKTHINLTYMSYVLDAKPETLLVAPAIVHEDGTSRVQVISKHDHSQLYELLSILTEEYNIPILLNTSFNLRGEPNVESPSDAIRTFASSGLDALSLEHLIVFKS